MCMAIILRIFFQCYNLLECCGCIWHDVLCSTLLFSLKQFPAREKYLNKKIDMYEEMSIVVGKDTTRGKFSKSFVDIDTCSSLEPLKSVHKDDNVSKLEIKASLQPKKQYKKSRVEDENSEIQQMSIQLGEVASFLQKYTSNQLDGNKLYEEIMKNEEFNEISLALAFDHLVEREQLAKAFLAKNQLLRKVWLENFKKN